MLLIKESMQIMTQKNQVIAHQLNCRTDQKLVVVTVIAIHRTNVLWNLSKNWSMYRTENYL